MSQRKWFSDDELARGWVDNAHAGGWYLNLHKAPGGGYHVVVWQNIERRSLERFTTLEAARAKFIEKERDIMVRVATELFDANA